MVAKEEFIAAREAAITDALDRVRQFTTHSDRFRGFGHLTAEQRAAVDGENAAFFILEQRGVLEKFVTEVIFELLPDAMAEQLISQDRPVAVFTPGALAANRFAFDHYVKWTQEGENKEKFQGYFIKDFESFYQKVYAKLKEYGLESYNLEQRATNFPGIRDMSGIMEAATQVAENFNCSFIASDNLDAHPKLDLSTAQASKAILVRLSQTHNIEFYACAVTPEEAIEVAKGTRFKDNPEQVQASARGFAASFNDLKELPVVITLFNNLGNIFYQRVGDEKPNVEPEFLSWLQACGVRPKPTKYAKDDELRSRKAASLGT